MDPPGKLFPHYGHPVFPASSLSLPPLPQKPLTPEQLSVDVDVFAKHRCDQCEYSTDKKDRLRRHVLTVHAKEKAFHCTQCEYSSARKDKVQRHMATVHTSEKPFKCNFCGHATNRKDKIKVHVESVHLKKVKTNAREAAAYFTVVTSL